MKPSALLITITLLLGLPASGAEPSAPTELSLAGEWRLSLEEAPDRPAESPSEVRFDDTIRLPGTTAAQRKGPAERFETRIDKETMSRLRERHPFVGVAWYEREVSVPADWSGKSIRLTLERVLWESRVWVDGEPLGQSRRSLSVPHRYDLAGRLTPGKAHTVTLRIDNRQIVPIGAIGHAYTAWTQTLWNGVIGRIALEALPSERIEHIRVVAEPNGDMLVEAEGDFSPSQQVVVSVTPHGETRNEPTQIATATIGDDKDGVVRLRGRLDGAKPWSGRSPALYTLTAELRSPSGESLSRKQTTFGFRRFEASGRKLLINGVPTFLRGNLECAIFPQTGHPDAEGGQWRKIMRVARDHGLNHLRFHSWCPPRAAFEAADEAGVYLQVELPNWTFEMGRNADADRFFLAEGKRILREYASHPSFVMLALGNELGGDLAAMDRLVEQLRAVEPELLYTSTSFAFSPRGKMPGPADDFFISQQTESGWVRGQGFLNSTFPSTDTDYAEGASCVDIPLVTHEVGQYVVYPDLATLPKYDDTPLRATAMEAIRDDLASKGLLGDAARFTRDSGKLAALLYKEDIERALRTKDLAGIQLLQLQDFPGQSTATVGLLDAFWDSKGLITPEEFRRFSAPVVPLARFKKFVWGHDERFAADIELANFSEGPIDTRFEASLIGPSGNVVASADFRAKDYGVGNGLSVGRFSVPLSSVQQATRLDLVVRALDAEAENRWPAWVYPTEPPAPEVAVHLAADEPFFDDLAAGKSVLLLPHATTIRRPIPGRFIPVFWSPLHFPNQPGTLGATIDSGHPLWRHFPTDTHTNWQWWELLAESTAVDLSGLDTAVDAPFRFVDKYDRNALPAAIFEARVGSGRLLVCTLDVTTDPGERIVARQLLAALKRRAASADFDPRARLTTEQLRALFGASRLIASAPHSHPDYPASHAIDGDGATIWHTDWRRPGGAEPRVLQVDLRADREVEGVRLQNRVDGRNGRVRGFRVETSLDGERWAVAASSLEMPNSGAPTDFRFDAATKARYLRIVVETTHALAGHASLAELQPLTGANPSDDVRDLGVIEGFNDG